MYMSTIRCCSTWKLPIGCPNCWRCLQYSTVSANTFRMQPDRLGADRRGAFVARLGERRPRLAVFAEQRIRRAAAARRTPVGRPAVVDSAVAVVLDARCRPSRFRRETARAPPDVRAVTSRWVASGALIATIFDRRSTHSSPSRSATVDTSCQRSPDAGSAAASATIAVPATTFSSSACAAGRPPGAAGRRPPRPCRRTVPPPAHGRAPRRSP